jgi:hypothetical protein
VKVTYRRADEDPRAGRTLLTPIDKLPESKKQAKRSKKKKR